MTLQSWAPVRKVLQKIFSREPHHGITLCTFDKYFCLYSSCAADHFTLSYEAEVVTCARICESLISSARGTEICITWIVGCLSIWMTTTFHCHISTSKYTIEFCLQKDGSICNISGGRQWPSWLAIIFVGNSVTQLSQMMTFPSQ